MHLEGLRKDHINAHAILTMAVGAALVASVSSCAFEQSSKEKVVTVSYAWPVQEDELHRWRALMEALDLCHFAGYRDAQLAGEPERVCESGDANTCAMFRVTLRYDCIGLGYQTSG